MAERVTEPRRLDTLIELSRVISGAAGTKLALNQALSLLERHYGSVRAAIMLPQEDIRQLAIEIALPATSTPPY